jgi:hypothetical protein
MYNVSVFIASSTYTFSAATATVNLTPQGMQEDVMTEHGYKRNCGWEKIDVRAQMGVYYAKIDKGSHFTPAAKNGAAGRINYFARNEDY